MESIKFDDLNLQTVMDSSTNPSPSAPASTPTVAASQTQLPHSSPATHEETLGGVRVSGVDYPPVPPAHISLAALPNPSLMTPSMPPQQWSPPHPPSTGFPQPQRFHREQSVSVYPGMQNTCRSDRPCYFCQHNPLPNPTIPSQQYPQGIPVQQYPIAVPNQNQNPASCANRFQIAIFVFIIFFTICIPSFFLGGLSGLK